jgi:FkbM family methyltransferase
MDLRVTDDKIDARVASDILRGITYPKPPLDPRCEIRTIADIGANLGAATLYFLSLWPEAIVHCWEPNPKALACLRRNTSCNVHIHPYGLWSSNEKRQLGCLARTVCSSLYRNKDYGDLLEIELRSAKEELAIEPWSVIKMDVEGAEREILPCAADSFRQAAVVYLEYHTMKDRLLVEEVLAKTHYLFHAKLQSPWQGELGYIRSDCADPLLMQNADFVNAQPND